MSALCSPVIEPTPAIAHAAHATTHVHALASPTIHGIGHHVVPHHPSMHHPPTHQAPVYGPPPSPVAEQCARAPGDLPPGPGAVPTPGAIPASMSASPGLAAALIAGGLTLAAAAGLAATAFSTSPTPATPAYATTQTGINQANTSQTTSPAPRPDMAASRPNLQPGSSQPPSSSSSTLPGALPDVPISIPPTTTAPFLPTTFDTLPPMPIPEPATLRLLAIAAVVTIIARLRLRPPRSKTSANPQ